MFHRGLDPVDPLARPRNGGTAVASSRCTPCRHRRLEPEPRGRVLLRFVAMAHWQTVTLPAEAKKSGEKVTIKNVPPDQGRVRVVGFGPKFNGILPLEEASVTFVATVHDITFPDRPAHISASCRCVPCRAFRSRQPGIERADRLKWTEWTQVP